MDRLTQKIEELKESLYSQPEIREYFLLRKALEEDERLMELEKQVRFHQRLMAENIGNDEVYFKEKTIYENLKRQYDSDPLVINYENIKLAVYDILKQIKEIIE